ncbi:hypothetical protein BH09BAC6_BH09BAC6_26720 [soil metagenome]
MIGVLYLQVKYTKIISNTQAPYSIKEYSTIDGGIVKMSDGNQWSISRRQLDLFLEKMKMASLMFGKDK